MGEEEVFSGFADNRQRNGQDRLEDWSRVTLHIARSHPDVPIVRLEDMLAGCEIARTWR